MELTSDATFDEDARKVVALVEGIVRGYHPIESVVIYEHRVTPSHRAPVWDDLVAAELIAPDGPGRVALAGDAARVADALSRVFERMADRFGATPHRYPSMLAVADLRRCNYFASFPHHLTFALHLREDLDAIRATMAPVDDDALLAHVKPPPFVLSPALCYHTYVLLEDRALDGPRIFTAEGRCYRFESKNLTTLERLWEFTMREIIFVGPRAWVEEQRERALSEVRTMVGALGLDAWIETANDPFFLDNFAAKQFFQLKTHAKLELRLGLPYSGTSLAAASFNVHEDFFGRSFGIT